MKKVDKDFCKDEANLILAVLHLCRERERERERKRNSQSRLYLKQLSVVHELGHLNNGWCDRNSLVVCAKKNQNTKKKTKNKEKLKRAKRLTIHRQTQGTWQNRESGVCTDDKLHYSNNFIKQNNKMCHFVFSLEVCT